jgi:hypothetical protein
MLRGVYQPLWAETATRYTYLPSIQRERTVMFRTPSDGPRPGGVHRLRAPTPGRTTARRRLPWCLAPRAPRAHAVAVFRSSSELRVFPFSSPSEVTPHVTANFDSVRSYGLCGTCVGGAEVIGWGDPPKQDDTWVV